MHKTEPRETFAFVLIAPQWPPGEPAENRRNRDPLPHLVSSRRGRQIFIRFEPRKLPLMHLLTWAAEQSRVEQAGEEGEEEVGKEGKEGRREGEARNWVGGEGEEKWKPESGIKRLKGRNGERPDAFRAAGKRKSPGRKPFYSGNRDH